jgi:DNA-binding NarL/FixJ family response regulator
MGLRLAIVDDEPLWLDLLRLALTNAGHEVVGAYSSSAEALRAWPAEVSQALIDVELGRASMHGFELARTLRSMRPTLTVVFLTSVVDPWMIDAAAGSAVAGTSYLLKRGVADVAQLDRVLRATAAGEVIVDPQVLRALGSGGPADGLSPLQLRVVRLMATGWSNAQIAEELGLSVKTVESNITRIAKALDIDHERNVRVECVTRYLAYAAAGPHRVVAGG